MAGNLLSVTLDGDYSRLPEDDPREERGEAEADVLPQAESEELEVPTGDEAEEILKRHGFRVRPVPNDSIENGIKAARQTLAQTVFDKDKAAPIVDALKRYRRAINSSTNEPGAPLHDDASHGADNYRYIALCAEQMTNEDEVMPVIVPSFDPLDTELGI